MIIIEIETNGNSAFDDQEFEICRILAELKKKFENGRFSRFGDYPILDINGNSCGLVSHIEDEQY